MRRTFVGLGEISQPNEGNVAIVIQIGLSIFLRRKRGKGGNEEMMEAFFEFDRGRK
jgi:hypothetical protein